ncbi:MAG: SGNH/GDSL hydrolase family protein [Candidatus Hydrogenedens sp.]|jgi:lysophospholipase L1-like esterase|nr:SGNH/GDSL hydrolase family protein [Candidatus Hydrogenedens sp.]
MKTVHRLLVNGLLVFLSIALSFLLVLGADRLLGSMRRPPDLPEAIELIFPPGAEQHYATSEFSYAVHINSIGIRDRELPRERGTAFRVLAIGDSYTYGWGVNIEDCWTRLLDEYFKASGRNVEVINLGKPGQGPRYYAEIAEKAIPLLRPDLVLVCMLQGNDIRDVGPGEEALPGVDLWGYIRRCFPNMTLYMRDLRREREHAHHSHLDMPPQYSSAEDNRNWMAVTAREIYEAYPPEEKARFDSFDEEVRSAFMSGDLNAYMVDLSVHNPDFYIMTMDLEDGWTQTSIERAARSLSHIRRVAEQYTSEAVVVSMPEGPYVNRPALKGMERVGHNMPEWLLETTAMDDSIEAAAKKAGMPFYKITELFREEMENPDLYFPLDGHPTAQGHALFARAFQPILDKLLPAASSDK